MWDHPGHFFGAAATAMRQVLVDDHRWRAAAKRGGGMVREDLAESELRWEPPRVDLLALDGLLRDLETRAPRKHRIVVLRFFDGLTAKETAELLGMSQRSVEREWAFVRNYLQMRLSEGGSRGRPVRRGRRPRRRRIDSTFETEAERPRNYRTRTTFRVAVPDDESRRTK
jgi:hypothetical protein